MAYCVKMINGAIFTITDSERNSVIGKTGMIYFPSCDRAINTNSMSEIVSEKAYLIDKQEQRKNQKEGILHDGTHVFRHFGEWYKLEGDYDSSGRPLTRFDPEMYPEVGRDCVPTKTEFYEKYAMLSQKERLQLMLKNVPDSRRLSSGQGLEKIDFNKYASKIQN